MPKKPQTKRVRSLAERRKFHLDDVKKGFRDPRTYNLTEKGKIHYGHITVPNDHKQKPYPSEYERRKTNTNTNKPKEKDKVEE